MAQPTDSEIMLTAGDDGLTRPTWATSDPLLREYYDTEWGIPVTDDQGMYERLTLEAFQSGLSWATILRKRPAFRKAFDNFDPTKVAAYKQTDIARLLNNAEIIRNKRKIEAAVTNAQATLDMGDREGLANFIWTFKPNETPKPRTSDEIPTVSPESIALAKALKRRGFVFVGPTTMYALMAAIGMVDIHLMDSHRRGCSGIWPE